VTQSRGKVRGKIQATQQWLTRAEEHFDRNAPARGELDLLLAEAELRSTRENIQSHPHRLNLTLIQQGFAFGMAAVLVAAGVSAAWWWQPERAESIPRLLPVSVTSPVAAPTRPDQTLKISAAIVQKPETSPAPAVDSTMPGQEVKTVEKSANREPSVSQEEMKRLVQAAGQSLRGRIKP